MSLANLSRKNWHFVTGENLFSGKKTTGKQLATHPWRPIPVDPSPVVGPKNQPCVHHGTHKQNRTTFVAAMMILFIHQCHNFPLCLANM